MKKVKDWSCDLWDYCSGINCPNYYDCQKDLEKQTKDKGGDD